MVEPLPDREIEARFGPPIYALANVDHDPGWAWTSRSRSDDHNEVTSVTIRHRAGEGREIGVTTQVLLAQTLRLNDEHWIATTPVGGRWVEIHGRGTSSQGLELTTLDRTSTGTTEV